MKVEIKAAYGHIDLPYPIKKIMRTEIQVIQKFSYASADASDVQHGNCM